MPAPPGFTDLINRKYNIQQQEATDRGALEQANAASITASTPFENALKAAQAFQTTETGKTVAPLANASQAATYAGVNETNARVGLTQAQTGLTGAQTQDLTADLGSIGLLGSRYYADQLSRMGVQFKQANPLAAGVSGAAPAGTTTQNVRSVLTAPTATPGVPAASSPASKISLGTGQAGYYDANGNYVLGLAKGTTRVKSPGKPMGGPVGLEGALMAAGGASRVPGHGSGKVDKVPAVLAPGEAVVNAAGVKHIPGGRQAIAKANAKGAKEMGMGRGMPARKGKGAPPPQARQHFAAGTDYVSAPPAPGQTVTSGSWLGPTSTAPSAPAAPPVYFPVPASAPAPARVFGRKQA